jgi:hypothetical protein
MKPEITQTESSGLIKGSTSGKMKEELYQQQL